MTEAEKLQTELDLVEQLLRTESQHLQELEEKRRLIGDGIADIEAPSSMWDDYLAEVDNAAAIARSRIQELEKLREATRAQLETIQ